MQNYQERLIDFYSNNNHPPDLHKSIFQGTQYIGQIDFWSADEISRFGTLLGLNEHSRLLDMGSGLGGPLCYLVEKYRCYGIGVEVSMNSYLNAVNRSKQILYEYNTLRDLQASEVTPKAIDIILVFIHKKNFMCW